MNDSNEPAPRTLRSEKVFSGRVFSVTRDEVEERGRTYVRETVHHAGSACILPLFDDGTIALVRQYRHPAQAFLLEIPAGSRNEGEEAAACARRELEEEIGVICERLELIAEFFPSPGLLAEKMWVYLATGLQATTQRLDDDEFVEIMRFRVEEAISMVRRGEISDAKTIIALHTLAARERK